MKASQIIISQKTIGDPPYLLTSISDCYEYKDGMKTTKHIGYNFRLVLPKRGFEAMTVFSPNKTFDVGEEAIEVIAENLAIGMYIRNNTVILKGKADSIKPYSKPLKMRVSE